MAATSATHARRRRRRRMAASPFVLGLALLMHARIAAGRVTADFQVTDCAQRCGGKDNSLIAMYPDPDTPDIVTCGCGRREHKNPGDFGDYMNDALCLPEVENDQSLEGQYGDQYRGLSCGVPEGVQADNFKCGGIDEFGTHFAVYRLMNYNNEPNLPISPAALGPDSQPNESEPINPQPSDTANTFPPSTIPIFSAFEPSNTLIEDPPQIFIIPSEDSPASTGRTIVATNLIISSVETTVRPATRFVSTLPPAETPDQLGSVRGASNSNDDLVKYLAFGIAGGLIVMGVLGGIIWFCLRARKRRKTFEKLSDDAGGQAVGASFNDKSGGAWGWEAGRSRAGSSSAGKMVGLAAVAEMEASKAASVGATGGRRWDRYGRRGEGSFLNDAGSQGSPRSVVGWNPFPDDKALSSGFTSTYDAINATGRDSVVSSVRHPSPMSGASERKSIPVLTPIDTTLKASSPLASSKNLSKIPNGTPRRTSSITASTRQSDPQPSDSVNPFQPNGDDLDEDDVTDMIGKRFECTVAYEPQLGDEVSLRLGDVVFVKRVFNDGWAYGVNETLKISGAFPLFALGDDDEDGNMPSPVQ
ncbi:hypothetical protein HDU67_002402 [Dinochytrium kinnereticum]|nr:hypothetical protein HDU67_002402 [Dinochytrium kinnereticum]